jgi:uncharacterized protein (DUF2147 family)
MRQLFLTLMIGAALTAPAFATPEAAIGEWMTPGERGRIKLAPCGEALCGTLIAVKPGNSSRDERNPNPALKNRDLIGVQLMTGLTRKGAGWAGGRGYDPDRGMNFRAEITPQANGSLRVKGCVGPICEVQVWTKAN